MRMSAAVRPLFDVASSIAVLGAAFLVVWNQWPTTKPADRLPAKPVSIVDAPLIGDSKARVVVVEYSDFQCPFCGQFVRNTWGNIKDRYVRQGRVALAFRDLPLEQIHPFALGAATAAECARRQGHFWEMHDSLFADQGHLDKPSLLDRAKGLQMDIAAFQSCIQSDGVTLVRRDLANAADIGIRQTPTFLIGYRDEHDEVHVVRRLSGAVPLDDFSKALDALLDRRTINRTEWWLASGFGLLTLTVGLVVRRRKQRDRFRGPLASI